MSLKTSTFFIVLCLFLIPQLSLSQETKRLQLNGGISADLAFFDEESIWGFGAHLKLLWSPGKSDNAFVFGTDYDMLSGKDEYNGKTDTHTFTLASIGYRIRTTWFYIEPRLGGGLYKEEDYNSGCFFIGLEPGIQKEKFNFSIDYRLIVEGGMLWGTGFHTFSAKIGYRIFGKEKQ